jgi:hypothetical protein
MKKFSLIISLISLLILPLSVYANDDIVDLQKNHWAYESCIKATDTYKLMSVFPDHTFRGNKAINKFELSAITLKLIQILENDGLKASVNTNKIDYPETFFEEVINDKTYSSSISDLRDKYNIYLGFPDDLQFDGKNEISKIELALYINSTINLFLGEKDLNKNPYAYEKTIDEKTTISKEELIKNTIEDIKTRKILNITDKTDNEKVNRYELAVVLIKTLEYINNYSKHHF